MKKLFILLISTSLFVACTSKIIDKETALKMLREQKGYPKTLDAEIYIADPADAKKSIDAGLEKDGYVRIAHTQKLSDVGQPIITFTDKAKPFLIPQSEEDKKDHVQRVRVAAEVIDEIANVKMGDDGKSALVEFKSLYKDKTPFFVVSGILERNSNISQIEIDLH